MRHGQYQPNGRARNVLRRTLRGAQRSGGIAETPFPGILLVMKTLFALGCLLVLLGCASVPRQTDSAAGYQGAIAALAGRPTVAAESDAERQAIARVKGFLANWSVSTIQEQTETVYAPDAYLNDTLKTVRGAAQIRDYFLATATNTESITVQFEDVTRGADDTYYFRWVMDVRMKKVARGESIRTPGITLIRFDAQGRVQVHQDYWDSGAGLWEHVPMLGRAIRTIKARL